MPARSQDLTPPRECPLPLTFFTAFNSLWFLFFPFASTISTSQDESSPVNIAQPFLTHRGARDFLLVRVLRTCGRIVIVVGWIHFKYVIHSLEPFEKKLGSPLARLHCTATLLGWLPVMSRGSQGLVTWIYAYIYRLVSRLWLSSFHRRNLSAKVIGTRSASTQVGFRESRSCDMNTIQLFKTSVNYYLLARRNHRFFLHVLTIIDSLPYGSISILSK